MRSRLMLFAVVATLFTLDICNRCPAQQVVRRRPAITKPIEAPYRLDAGDFLAIVVDGVVGSLHEAKVHLPKPGDGTLPAVGIPVLVLKDGTLGLPLIDPIRVQGMTIQEAKSAVESAYNGAGMIARKHVVMLSLLRKRTIDVTVFHTQPEHTNVDKVRLEESIASPLAALANSSRFDPRGKVTVVSQSPSSRLKDGDRVRVNSAPRGFFFAGGSLKAGQYALPANRHVSVLQAIAIAGGTGSARPLDPLNVVISSPSRGTIAIPYHWLLRNPSAYPINRGDTVVLR